MTMKVNEAPKLTLEQMEQQMTDAHNRVVSMLAQLESVGHLREPTIVDTMGPVPKKMDGEVSSVRPRVRNGDGLAAHEVMTSGCSTDLETIDGFPIDDCGLPVFHDPLENLFTGGTMAGLGLESGAGGSYLERRQIAYFLAGMRENSKALSDLDFYRGEEHWDGRYNHDHEARIDESVRFAESDRDFQRYSEMERRASNLQAELQFTDSQNAYDDWSHQQSLRDYHG